MAEVELSLRRLLQRHWGHLEFRPLQLQAMLANLQGRDSLVILPTGLYLTVDRIGLGSGGVYAYPVHNKRPDAMLLQLHGQHEHAAQVARCEEVTIEACTWNSETSEDLKQAIIRDLHAGQPSYKLLYTTPESLRVPALREALTTAASNGCLMSFAIDEAHCVSEWGHNFRPAYLQLSSLKDDFPSVPIAAFTATATTAVKKSITEILQLKDPVTLQGSFNRANIQYEVKCKENIGDGSPDAILQVQEGSGIVYAHLRATADWVASGLIDADIDAAAYHAGKPAQKRKSVQRDWADGSLACVVATIAFGLGIDKGDCRYVVHWNSSSSLEGFYQESGRAGRDGQPCKSLLYASNQDIRDLLKLEKGARRGAVQVMNDYALASGCRRKKLLGFFGEKDHCCSPPDMLCDFCTDPEAVRVQLRRQESAIAAKSVAAACRLAGQGLTGEQAVAQQSTGVEPPDPVLAGMAHCSNSEIMQQQRARPKRSAPPAEWSCALPSSRPLPSGAVPEAGSLLHGSTQLGTLSQHAGCLQQGTPDAYRRPWPGPERSQSEVAGECVYQSSSSLDRSLKPHNDWIAPALPAKGSATAREHETAAQISLNTVHSGKPAIPLKPVMKRVKRRGFNPPRTSQS